MPDKETVAEIIRRAPAARAYGPHTHPIARSTLGRVWAVLLLVLGAACILLTQQVYRALPFLLGTAMAVMGISRTVFGLWVREYRWQETKFTANGIVYFLLGLVILFHRANADAVIGSVWGVLGLMKGSEALNTALYRFSGKEPCAAMAFQAVVELVLGFLLLTDPSTAVQHHVLLLGLELIAVGWQSLREAK